jgi:hypothetical protein
MKADDVSVIWSLARFTLVGDDADTDMALVTRKAETDSNRSTESETWNARQARETLKMVAIQIKQPDSPCMYAKT